MIPSTEPCDELCNKISTTGNISSGKNTKGQTWWTSEIEEAVKKNQDYG